MAEPSEVRRIPVPTLRRLPRYLHYLRHIQASRPAVSSSHLAEVLHLDAIQIRKDLECTGTVGRPRIGYDVKRLIEAIEAVLGWNHPNEAFLVGAGNLGGALLGYPRFRDAGLEIAAAFDIDPARVGTRVHGKEVLPVAKLTNLAQRMHVLMGIITVPAEAAQEVADAMVAGGIRAIWNFAPITLHVPPEVAVQNEDLYSGLATLSQELAALLHREPALRKVKAAPRRKERK